MKRSWQAWWLIPILVVLVALPNCSDRDKKETEPDTNPDASDYEASAAVSTTQERTIETETGASIQVPRYAVPETESGGTGTMVFSIERDQTSPAAPPTGHTTASDVYRFGPDGFTFAEMVKVSIPVLGDTTGKNYALQRIDPTSGISETVSGTFDPSTGTVTGQTYHLSSWYVTSYMAANTAYGAFHVTNLSTTHWLKICVVEYTLKYPAVDSNFDGGECMWAPVGTIGWASSGNWYLPQGTYKLCVSMNTAGTISAPPGDPQHWFIDNKVLDAPWSIYQPTTSDLTVNYSAGALPGGCDCTPVPSTSVGSGEVQVTLTWHNAQSIDLDLYVTEPGGETCYFGHDSTSTGGALDRDNTCGSYVNGRPENIFWTDAPAGQYKVKVDWWSDCGNEIASQAFDVRVVAGGNVKTYHGTIAEETEVQVCTFTVGSLARSMSSSDSWIPVEWSAYDGASQPSGPREPKS
ncbi:MAG: hypothetical protein KBD56_04690 [Candidatus Eisenbacteria bacterium]|nr:hypothetical protein [Candidatus Eisenbacteria bacterium]